MVDNSFIEIRSQEEYRYKVRVSALLMLSPTILYLTSVIAPCCFNYWGVTCLRAVNEGVRKRTSLFGVLSFRWDGPHGLWIGHLREQALCEHLMFTRPQPEVPSPPLAWEQRHTQRSHVAVS